MGRIDGEGEIGASQGFKSRRNPLLFPLMEALCVLEFFFFLFHPLPSSTHSVMSSTKLFWGGVCLVKNVAHSFLPCWHPNPSNPIPVPGRIPC